MSNHKSHVIFMSLFNPTLVKKTLAIATSVILLAAIYTVSTQQGLILIIDILNTHTKTPIHINKKDINGSLIFGFNIKKAQTENLILENIHGLRMNKLLEKNLIGIHVDTIRLKNQNPQEPYAKNLKTIENLISITPTVHNVFIGRNLSQLLTEETYAHTKIRGVDYLYLNHEQNEIHTKKILSARESHKGKELILQTYNTSSSLEFKIRGQIWIDKYSYKIIGDGILKPNENTWEIEITLPYKVSLIWKKETGKPDTLHFKTF